MAIQIIDNFNLSVAKPIDDRFVVGSQSFYTDKNNIPYKYSGLRVWDLDLGIPYVWNGSTWASENSVSVSGSGSASYVPKFVGSGNSNAIGNSNIYISGPTVGINNTSPAYTLDVNGTINSNILRSLDGSNILLLNATNISSGTLQLAYLSNINANTTFVPGWGILASGASQPTYINPSTLTVGGSSASVIFSDTNSSSLHYIGFFNGYSGTLPTRVSRVSGTTPTPSVRQLTYQPSTGTLTSALITTGTFSSTTSNITTLNISSAFNVVPASTAASPAINFSSYGGIYHTTAPNLGISVSGAAKLIVEQNAVNFGPQSNNYPRIVVSSTSTAGAPSYTWYGDTNTGMYRPSDDTIALSTGGVARFIVSSTTATSSGISMISSTCSKWSITSISVDRWVSDLIGTTSGSAFDLPSASHDRIIYANHSGSGTIQVYLYAETTGGTFEMLNRSSPSGYSGTMMILPANKRWRAFLEAISGSGTVTFHIYKFGLGY
jgi:hypothetical protein